MIPPQVIEVYGINQPIISIENFAGSADALAGISNTGTITNFISNISLVMTGSNCVGFVGCANLYNCHVSIPINSNSVSGTGFQNCHQCQLCSANVGTNEYGSYGFTECRDLINCTVTAFGNGDGTFGYANCKTLNGCISYAASNDRGGYGFYNCEQLDNCIGTGEGFHGNGFGDCIQLNNCTGTGTGMSEGYGFCNCSWINGCKQGTDPSTTGFLGGTNTKVDTLTVIAR